jgi:ribonuclease J
MLTYLKKLNNLRSFENGVLIYSIWSGYKERPNMKKFLDEMQKRGLKVITLHTSGHADPQTIDELINTVRPKVIIPVHTENAEWFDRYKKMCNVSYDKEVII